MTLTSWQHRNYLLVRDRFLSPDDLDTLLLSSFWPLSRSQDLLPVNPWFNCFEILGFAWRHRAIEAPDIDHAWSFARDHGTGTGVHELFDKRTDKRPFLALFRDLIQGHSLPMNQTERPFSAFPIFADIHWQFRRELKSILAGLLIQSSFRDFDHKAALRWLEANEEGVSLTQAAFRGLLSLHTYLLRIDRTFAELPQVREDLKLLYKPWREAIQDDVRKALDEFLSSTNPNIT